MHILGRWPARTYHAHFLGVKTKALGGEGTYEKSHRNRLMSGLSILVSGSQGQGSPSVLFASHRLVKSLGVNQDGKDSLKLESLPGLERPRTCSHRELDLNVSSAPDSFFDPW